MTEGVGDVRRFDGVPFAVVGVMVVVSVDRCVGPGAVSLEVHRDASEGFTGAVERVGVGFVANSFATDSILLVSELQRGGLEAGGDNGIIQRCCEAGVHPAVDGEMEVFELEGLRACFRCEGVEVFSGAKEPEETDNGEVDCVLLEGTQDGVVDVKGVAHALEDGETDGVGASDRVVVGGHGFEERSEWGMVLSIRDWISH